MKWRFALWGLLFVSTFVQAANMWCQGTVSHVYVDASNNLMISGSWRGDFTRLCTTDGSAGIGEITCTLWFSIAATALKDQKSVRLMYDDQGGTLTCANLPTYSNTPVPQYVMLSQ